MLQCLLLVNNLYKPSTNDTSNRTAGISLSHFDSAGNFLPLRWPGGLGPDYRARPALPLDLPALGFFGPVALSEPDSGKIAQSGSLRFGIPSSFPAPHPVSVPRPGARAARELRHLTAVAGVSQSPAGRRGYGTLGHGLFPAAASPLQCRDQPKIKKMFDQLLLVLGARNQM